MGIPVATTRIISPRAALAAGLVALALTSSGCITLGKAAKGIYLPDYEVFTGSLTPRAGPVVLVEDARAGGAYDSLYMVQRTSAAGMDERRDTEWRVKPAALVTEKLLEHFMASDRFGWARSSGRPLDLRVRARVRRFDEVHDAGGWSAVFAVDIEVLAADEKPVAYLRIPEVRKPAATADSDGVADAMAEAMREGLDAAVVAVANAWSR